MKKVFYTILAACLALTACEKGFEPAADPQAWPQEDARTLPTAFAVTPVGSIDLAAQTGETVQVATLGASTLPEDASYGPFTLVLDGTVSIPLDENLNATKEDLQNAVASLYGKRPVEHAIQAVIMSSVQIEGQGFRLESNVFEMKVTPEAPVLEQHYYYIGAANGWSTTDKSFEFTNASGSDYYDDPVVSVTIPAPVDADGNRVDNWFKVSPGSNYDLADFWSGSFIGAAEDGETAYEGKYVFGNGTGAFNVGPGTEEAVYYTITLNLLDQTYSVKVLNFPAALYMVGTDFGSWNWNSDGVVALTPVLHNPDWGADAEGQFYTVRYLTAGNGVKFNSNRDWDGKQFGSLQTNDGFTNDDDGNLVVAEDGIYLIHIDMKRSILHVEPARVYGMGPAFGGWNEEMEPALFAVDGQKLKITVPYASSELRIYVASSIATSGWWTREFNIFDGKIVPRLMDELAKVSVKADQQVILDFNAGTGEITGEGAAPTLPENMYLVGEGIVDWSTFVPMTPFHSQAGAFWAIRYLEAGKAFKFSPDAGWEGRDFYQLDYNEGVTVSGTNLVVEESGVYCIGVDYDNSKIVVEPAKVYGMGSAWGDNWTVQDASKLFTVEGKTLVGTATTDGNVRTYVDSKILSGANDWWHAEFIPKDGQIVFRGTGGDPDAVAVKAGQKIIYDFNAGTGVIE